ncbi:hypothetical protein ACQCQ6_25690, partial [Ralstonia pseudosolanacearum]|uniref:hypothetical protein n=1 Tax=Ralstonia pseudosolanacearum TaxID=1310165 RepID=UPI003CEFFE9A
VPPRSDACTSSSQHLTRFKVLHLVLETKETAHPTELDQLKSLLGQLWKDRCSFAHADMNTNVAAQQMFNAPSWTISQHAKLVQLLGRYEQALLGVMAQI